LSTTFLCSKSGNLKAPAFAGGGGIVIITLLHAKPPFCLVFILYDPLSPEISVLGKARYGSFSPVKLWFSIRTGFYSLCLAVGIIGFVDRHDIQTYTCNISRHRPTV
jgi:hypothetical protein